MLIILQKELNYFFKGMFGYFFGAVLLMFAGIYTVMVNCNLGYASFEYTLNNMAFLYLILIPVLTMRSVSEERRQKTDQLLFSLPLSMTEVIVGKYLAVLAALLLPILIMAVYPLFLLPYGAVSLRMAYGALIGFFLLGASMASIGIFLSTLTENQTIAAALSFAVFLLMYFGSNLTDHLPGTAFASMAALAAVLLVGCLIFLMLTKDRWVSLGIFCGGMILLEILYMTRPRIFEGLFADLVSRLSVFERFYAFVRGVFDLRAVIYFLSLIIFFLYLSVQSMEKRRWS